MDASIIVVLKYAFCLSEMFLLNMTKKGMRDVVAFTFIHPPPAKLNEQSNMVICYLSTHQLNVSNEHNGEIRTTLT